MPKSKWQPIDTAPKDNDKALVFGVGAILVAIK